MRYEQLSAKKNPRPTYFQYNDIDENTAQFGRLIMVNIQQHTTHKTVFFEATKRGTMEFRFQRCIFALIPECILAGGRKSVHGERVDSSWNIRVIVAGFFLDLFQLQVAWFQRWISHCVSDILYQIIIHLLDYRNLRKCEFAY
jgi:hypothetical protein